MVISRDEPGQSIVLHEESVSFWKNGGLGLLVLVPLCTVPVGFVFLVPRGPGGGRGPDDWVLGVATALWSVLICALLIKVMRNSRRLALLSADRSAGECVVEEWAPLACFARRSTIPLEEIERIELWTVREFGKPKGAHLPLRLRLDLRGRRTYDLPHALEVHGLDRHEEALDLAVRLAHVIGLGHQRIAKNDHVEFHVFASRATEEGSSPVAPLSAPAEYERGQVGIPADLARSRVPPFDPRGFQSEHRVMRWEPGNEVLLVRLATPERARKNTLGCGVVFLFGVVMEWVVCLWAGLPAFMPWAASVAGLAAWMLAVWDHQRRAKRGEVRVDWGLRRFAIDRFGTRLDVPFDAIERIEVRALRSLEGGTEGEAPYNLFRMQVFLHLKRALRSGARVELVVETDQVKDDPVGPYRSALPFGVELASALGVPYVYHDYP